VDLLKELPSTRHFRQELYSQGLISMNDTIFTRPAARSLLDHVYASQELSQKVRVNILISALSDHRMLIVDLQLGSVPRVVSVKERLRLGVDYSKTSDILETKSIALQSNDVVSAHASLISAVDEVIPEATTYTVLRVRAKDRYLFPFWATEDFIQLTRRKNIWYNKFMSYPGNVKIREEYKRCSNMLRTLSHKLKADYIVNTEIIKDTKVKWRAIKAVLNRKIKTTKIEHVTTSDGYSSDPVVIADTLNDHFLKSGIPSFPRQLGNTFAQSGHPKWHSFSGVTEHEIHSLISKMANKRSKNDGIPLKLLKHCSSTLLKPLTEIVNLSLNQGVVPNAVKFAIVIAIHKRNDPVDPDIYWPIAMLKTVSKILEKVVKKTVG